MEKTVRYTWTGIGCRREGEFFHMKDESSQKEGWKCGGRKRETMKQKKDDDLYKWIEKEWKTITQSRLMQFIHFHWFTVVIRLFFCLSFFVHNRTCIALSLSPILFLSHRITFFHLSDTKFLPSEFQIKFGSILSHCLITKLNVIHFQSILSTCLHKQTNPVKKSQVYKVNSPSEFDERTMEMRREKCK